MRHANKRCLILSADDDSDDQLFMQEAYDELKLDCDLKFFPDGRALADFLENEFRTIWDSAVPCMVFLDLNMPIKNGYDALREIRGSSDYQQTPVIIFSTSNDHQAISRSKELGANMFISKPPSYERLKEILQEVLSFNWVMPNPPDQQFFYTS